MFINRRMQPLLLERASQFRVVTLTGPRQSGKTTLARQSFPDKPYYALDRPDVQGLLLADPVGSLARMSQGAVLDEVQNLPEILHYLRAEVDERPTPGRFVLTGSQNLALSAHVSESLAGRTDVLELLPLAYAELAAAGLGSAEWLHHVWRGGFPALWASPIDAEAWLGAYAATYLERDVRQLSRVADLRTFGTFLRLVAARSGRLLNVGDLARDAGVAHGTAAAWLSILETSYVIQLLPAWHANASKRLVKAPKLHLLDTGLACLLLGIRTPDDLWHNPARGALVESWVAAELAKRTRNDGKRWPLHHFRSQTGLELDLVLQVGGELRVVEVKSSETVLAEDIARMQAAVALLAETVPAGTAIRPVLVYGGERAWQVGEVQVMGWRAWAG